VAATNVVRDLWMVGLSCLFISSSLFLCMAVELNKALPSDKRFPLLEIKMHFHEIKRLHENLFPVSTLRTAWFVLLVVSVSAMAIGVILAIRPLQ